MCIRDSFLSEYAGEALRSRLKPLLEILAGIPTVVYGFFAALTVAPLVREFGTAIGLEASSESALAAGLVMGVMIIPFVSSLSDDILHAVPLSLRDGSLALGATRSETIKRVVIPAALPGIVGGVLGLLYGGFSYTRETHDAKVGPLEFSVSEKERVNVPVWAGVVLAVVGAGLLVTQKK